MKTDDEQALSGTEVVYAGWERHKYAQGTKECIAFMRGAQWWSERQAQQPQAASRCELGCTSECKAKQHGCASECPALPWQPQAEAVPVGQIAQSAQDFESFWRTINAKGLTKRNLAKVAWNISHQKTKQRIKQMKNADTVFDGSNAENLAILDVRDKGFLRDLAAHAIEARESVVPAWADAYTKLADAAQELAQMVERTEVQP